MHQNKGDIGGGGEEGSPNTAIPQEKLANTENLVKNWRNTDMAFMISHTYLKLYPSLIFCSSQAYMGPLYVSGKVPTYPSPKPTFYPKWQLSVNVGLGEG